MRNIRIYLFGKFEIWVDNHRVDEKISKSKKNKTFIQYLILHRSEPVEYGDLYDLLWPNGENINPESSLKTMVSRLRADFVKLSPELADCIGTKHGAYIWKENNSVLIDVYEFEDLCKYLNEFTPQNDSDMIHFKRLYHLYSGNILYAGTEDHWIIRKNLYYRELYKKYITRHIELLCVSNQYDEAITSCVAALKIDPYDEQIRMLLTNAQMKSERESSAHSRHKRSPYLAEAPSHAVSPDSLQALSDSMQRLDRDLTEIHNELQGFGDIKGAFICDYTIFKEIYNLHLRTVKRNHNFNVFLAVFMMSMTNAEENISEQIGPKMKILKDVMIRSLRKNDTVAQYSPSQFVLLLPCSNYEDCQKIMERVKKEFYKEQSTASVYLNYRAVPIENRE